MLVRRIAAGLTCLLVALFAAGYTIAPAPSSPPGPSIRAAADTGPSVFCSDTLESEANSLVDAIRARAWSRALTPSRREDPRDDASQIFAAASSSLEGLGSYTCIEVPGALGWYWDRTSCCLWYQTTSGAYCDDCSLHEPAELAARRRADLIGGTAP